MTIPVFATKRKPESLDSISYQTILQEAHEHFDMVSPSSEDEYKIALLLVDCCVDFCHPTGSLYIPGALENIQKTASFIYKNLERITTIIAVADSHMPHHIFFAPWWINEFGDHPESYTIISYQDIVNHKYIPTIDKKSSIQYVKTLEETGKKSLCIWPAHCLSGSLGQKIMPALSEAILYHSFMRTTNPIYMEKGATAMSEYYGIFYPEVPINNHHQVEINTKLFDVLMAHDRIYIAGQSKSHCVLETLKQIALYDKKHKTNLLKKNVLLDDCCSIIKHPEIDFVQATKQSFDLLYEQGLGNTKAHVPI
jgi:nicotinamidase-related amidase